MAAAAGNSRRRREGARERTVDGQAAALLVERTGSRSSVEEVGSGKGDVLPLGAADGARLVSVLDAGSDAVEVEGVRALRREQSMPLPRPHRP